jgi:hypothetical protein
MTVVLRAMVRLHLDHARGIGVGRFDLLVHDGEVHPPLAVVNLPRRFAVKVRQLRNADVAFPVVIGGVENVPTDAKLRHLQIARGGPRRVALLVDGEHAAVVQGHYTELHATDNSAAV